MQDALGGLDHVARLDVPAPYALSGGKFGHLDVHPEQVAALARDDHQRARLGLDQRLVAYVGEVRDREDVHHAPGMVGRLTHEMPTDLLAYDAARTVAPDDVARPDRALGRIAVDRAQRHADGMITGLGNREAGDLEAVVGLQPGGRALHRLEQEVLDPGLVQDHVRELRESVLDVLDPAGARQPALGVGSPEDGLGDPGRTPAAGGR